jgi:hypothetical protein
MFWLLAISIISFVIATGISDEYIKRDGMWKVHTTERIKKIYFGLCSISIISFISASVWGLIVLIQNT